MAKSRSEKALDGLEKLAFGKCNDAAALVFSDDLPAPDVLRRMNLFNVASIKRDKGGGVEIHFFDRQKALETLYQFDREGADDQSAASFFEALCGGDADGV